MNGNKGTRTRLHEIRRPDRDFDDLSAHDVQNIMDIADTTEEFMYAVLTQIKNIIGEDRWKDPIGKNILFKHLPIVQCGVSVQLNDFVYQNGGGVLMRARASALTTMPCVGIVVDKPSEEFCRIAQSTILEGLTGIVNRKKYYISISLPGKVQNYAPYDDLQVMQYVATGLGSDKLMVHIDPTNFVVRRTV